MGGACGDEGGGVPLAVGGGVFVSPLEFALGDGNDASCVGRILLGVLPLDWEGVTGLEGEGVAHFGSKLLTFFSTVSSFTLTQGSSLLSK